MTAPDRMVDGSFHQLVERCHEAGWTDGLPVIPPTSELVDEMLGGRSPGEIVAVLGPGRGVATMRKAAANAVMAGCLPDAFPVLLAALRAFGDERFGAESLLTSLHSSSPLRPGHGGCNHQLAGRNRYGDGCRLRHAPPADPSRATATVGKVSRIDCCIDPGSDAFTQRVDRGLRVLKDAVVMITIEVEGHGRARRRREMTGADGAQFSTVARPNTRRNR